MPAGFDRCRANGGRIRTISGPDKHMGLEDGEYLHICILKGKVHRGFVKKKDASSDGSPADGGHMMGSHQGG